MFGQEEMTQFKNIPEPWAIFDTLIVSSQFFGGEQSVQGWFPSMNLFGQESEHLFFKQRNRGNCSLAYNNQQSADRSDFAFHVISIGMTFFAPITPQEDIEIVEINRLQQSLSHFWTTDLPNHCALTFRLGPDVKLECNAYHAPPGYGPVVSGLSQLGLQSLVVPPNGGPGETVWENVDQSVLVQNQGLAMPQNRFVFQTSIGIPRNETFECSLVVSEYARSILQNVAGPGDYLFSRHFEGERPTRFPTRYGIQVSLFGIREVQQRGEYHATAER